MCTTASMVPAREALGTVTAQRSDHGIHYGICCDRGNKMAKFKGTLAFIMGKLGTLVVILEAMES